MSFQTEEVRAKFLAELTEEELRYLASGNSWWFWGRQDQLPPPGEWVTWALFGGRGSGKTRSGAEWSINKARKYPRGALVGRTAADVRDVMLEGESGILSISPNDFMPKYKPSKRRLDWPNGSRAYLYTAEEPRLLRGPQFWWTWADEVAFWQKIESWTNLMFGLRRGPNPQACVTSTVRPTKIIKELMADPVAKVVLMSTYDNLANLSPIFVSRVVKKYEGTRLGEQELFARLLEDIPGALWKRQAIDDSRVSTDDVPGLDRIVVAIDPGTADRPDDSDDDDVAETGIIVVGIKGQKGSINSHAFVLEDCSLRGSPDEWGRVAVGAYNRWEADRIVAESNNGGAMVRFVLQTIGRNVPVSLVWASKGKVPRAEPVAALYEQRRVHHVGEFADLEQQMCNYVQGMKSPDRMDGLVWGITELMLESEGEYITPPLAAPDISLTKLSSWSP